MTLIIPIQGSTSTNQGDILLPHLQYLDVISTHIPEFFSQLIAPNLTHLRTHLPANAKSLLANHVDRSNSRITSLTCSLYDVDPVTEAVNGLFDTTAVLKSARSLRAWSGLYLALCTMPHLQTLLIEPKCNFACGGLRANPIGKVKQNHGIWFKVLLSRGPTIGNSDDTSIPSQSVLASTLFRLCPNLRRLTVRMVEPFPSQYELEDMMTMLEKRYDHGSLRAVTFDLNFEGARTPEEGLWFEALANRGLMVSGRWMGRSFDVDGVRE